MPARLIPGISIQIVLPTLLSTRKAGRRKDNPVNSSTVAASAASGARLNRFQQSFYGILWFQ